MTAERQVPGPPTSVRTRTMSDTIVVTWLPPLDGALVRGYMIGYGEGVPDVNWRYVGGAQREITLTGLSRAELVQFKISIGQ